MTKISMDWTSLEHRYTSDYSRGADEWACVAERCHSNPPLACSCHLWKRKKAFKKVTMYSAFFKPFCYLCLLFWLKVPKFKTNQMYTQNYSKNPRPKCKSNKCFQIISNVKNPMKMTYIVIVRHKKMNNKFVYFWKLLPNHQRSS
jgi:hypothetical protein